MAPNRPEKVPYPARASDHGMTLAESRGALRLDVPDAAPQMWFPRSDVAETALATLATDAWQQGEDELADHITFDHELVELVIVDAVEGDAERDITTKAFPTWGDGVDLVEVLDVTPDGELGWSSAPRSDWRRPVVEGSQMLGQAIVAASRHVPGRRAVTASMAFTRPVDARQRYLIELDEVSNGRTFAALGVRATQGSRTCGAGFVLLDVTAPDVIRHAEPAPDVAGPYDAEPFDMSVTGRDLRVVDAAYTGDPDAPVGPPELSVWVRFRDVPDDQPIHAALLAQFTGHISIAAALRPHAGIGQAQAHRTLSTAINAISLSIHADIRADRWMLYHHRCTNAGDGMTHSECRVYDEDRSHVASFTVDAMVRAFDDPARGADARTAL